MPGEGKRFEPGKSGNPGGRPKQDVTVTELAKSHTEMAIRVLAEIAQDPKAAKNSRVKACELLLNRGHGTPRQSIELTGRQGDDLNLNVVLVSATAPALEEPEPEEKPSLDEVRAEHARRRKES